MSWPMRGIQSWAVPSIILLALAASLGSWNRHQPAGPLTAELIRVAAKACPTAVAQSPEHLTLADGARVLDSAAWRVGVDAVFGGNRCGAASSRVDAQHDRAGRQAK